MFPDSVAIGSVRSRADPAGATTIPHVLPAPMLPDSKDPFTRLQGNKIRKCNYNQRDFPGKQLQTVI